LDVCLHLYVVRQLAAKTALMSAFRIRWVLKAYSVLVVCCQLYAVETSVVLAPEDRPALCFRRACATIAFDGRCAKYDKVSPICLAPQAVPSCRLRVDVRRREEQVQMKSQHAPVTV
jgi:hypothetical protein